MQEPEGIIVEEEGMVESKVSLNNIVCEFDMCVCVCVCVCVYVHECVCLGWEWRRQYEVTKQHCM